MTVTLQNGSSGLLDIQGKAIYVQSLLDTARLTTIPTQIATVLNIWESTTLSEEIAGLVNSIIDGNTAWKSSGAVLFAGIQSAISDLLIELFDADSPLSPKVLKTALIAMIDQMVADGDSIDGNSVAATVTAGGSNAGNGVVMISVLRPDGRYTEHAYAETLTLTASGATSIAVIGEPTESPASELWPAGSGAAASLSGIVAGASLLPNGGFETASSVASTLPDDWIVSVGTAGTTILLTTVEVQTITVTGTPTTGYYLIGWQNADGDTQYTEPLAYNASASAVQTALRALTGLESVTVTSTGTSPNFTHTITFTGMGGNIAQVTVVEETDSGTYTPGTTTAGTGLVFAGGRSLAFASNGSQLTAIQTRLTLEAKTAYAFSGWAAVQNIPVAGVMTVDLVDGIGGSVITDDEGNSNSFTFPATSLTATFQHLTDIASNDCCFRTPTAMPPIVYLRVRISSAIDSGSTVYLDHLALAKMTELYAGGPYGAAFTGSKAFQNADTWDVAITNDRAGAIQNAYNRNFGMAALGLVLPSKLNGTETIPDSVIGA